MDKTKQVKIDDVEYTIKKFTFGNRNEILDQTSVVDANDRMRMLSGTLRRLTIKLGVVKPKLSEEKIDAMDDQHGQKLFSAIQEFNVMRPLAP